ncbi:MAG TPA: hypothetical protein VFF67_04445 [Thermoplasmata archaeon]|nr:hypothetical protein [Thermoplasmata archaeon]
MAARRRRPPTPVPGYERLPGPLRHYRVVETGEEISRRQYQQLARGYFYEEVPKGKVRARARRAWERDWVRLIRSTLSDFANLSKTAILREMRRLGYSFPHHGAKRKATPAERARQEAFMEFIGHTTPTSRLVYPTLVDQTD